MMSKITIITDTDASLPSTLAAQYNIHQVPITVQFGEESFETGVDIDDAKLFARIDDENKLPTTAAPSPGKWAEAFQTAFDEGADEVICFTVSKALSSTYDAAVMAATDLMAGKSITVVDTNSLTMAQGYMVLAAAETVQQGGTSEEAIAAAKDVGERSHMFGALATLRYLAMSGRVGYVAAGMANLLNIKPILTIKEGKLELLEKIRTRKKAWQRLVDLTAEAAGENGIEKLAILHVDAVEMAHEFLAVLQKTVDCPEEVIITEMSAGLSVHTGAGMVGVCVISKE
ncbi:MAG: DegV family protein [Anaerolineaceae bacterium]|nr:DegV family protein [Anaerolineaceae bacterium]